MRLLRRFLTRLFNTAARQSDEERLNDEIGDLKYFAYRARQGQNDQGSSPCSRRDKVIDELLLPIRTCIDLSQCAELGIRAEDEVHARSGPFAFTRCAIAAFKEIGVF